MARRISFILFAVAGMFIAMGAVVGWYQYHANRASTKQAHEATARREAPSTTKPKEDAFAAYTVPPDQPRYLFIADTAVRAMVKPLGLTTDKHIGTPSNVFYAGWYTGSAKPGKPGAMLLDGHVSSWSAHGIFYNLKNLTPGKTITIERGDGTRFTYKVVKNQTYDDDKVDMAAAMAPITSTKPGLNLITCGGQVKKGTNEFNKRIVVFAEQM